MQLRHEYKHIISQSDFIVLHSRLSKIMQLDPHSGPDGCYFIRSLYFDTMTDKILNEKLDGLSHRQKYRIRCYNHSDQFIRLEKKIKINDLGTKVSATMSRYEIESILNGNIDFLLQREEEVLHDFYSSIQYEGLKPRTIVDYSRYPFVYAPGNVRVTLDFNIRSGMYSKDFFDFELPTLSSGDKAIVLEVKYDAFLPDIIRNAIQIGSISETAFSKYAACRSFEK